MIRNVALFLAAFLLCSGLFILVPAIDLHASGLFYRPGAGFFLADWTPFRLAHVGTRYLVTLVTIGLAVILVAALVRRRPLFGVDARAAVFLLLSLAVGPGLVVNAVFKDHWGRARPAQVTQFGGGERFTPPFVPSDQCTRNCAFPAGDPAVGFFFVSAALLVADRPRRRLAIGGALALGSLLGIVRVAQGGHFLSDVVISGFFVSAVGWALWRAVIVHDGLAALWHRLCRPPPGLRRFAVFAVAMAAAGALSYAFADRPLAVYFQAGDPTVRRLFQFISRFGVSTGWLVGTALIALVCRIAAAYAGDPMRARRLMLWGGQAAFVFAAIGLSGLIADIAKPVFARARPALYFTHRLFGFTGSGAHADHWSFPSGHTVTVSALALALMFLFPRFWPVYVAAAILVAASRVIIAAHYLSDVIGGAFLGIAVTWALWSAFRHAGLRVSRADADGFSDTP